MQTPKIIYLIDLGDEITWCDSPDPGIGMDPDDAVGYIKLSELAAAKSRIEELESMNSVIFDGYSVYQIAKLSSKSPISSDQVSIVLDAVNLLQKQALKEGRDND